ncbi:hypothetical protein EVAR_10870_1 [Eumeta japonica]|uniref:Uncharacterized protein n=1 Tax=Eumeta variegata TaxID=151549 RepID=A0A4C1UTA4_EUMVA|nr:hypothetical protein EVAR_10870_1 [Eumeta japonica]
MEYRDSHSLFISYDVLLLSHLLSCSVFFYSRSPYGHCKNWSSGKAATVQVEEFLLNVEKIGCEKRELFLSECSSTVNRFDKTIKKTPLHNFTSQIEKRKSVKVGGKTQEIKIQRDLFGRMLGISMTHELDVMKILSHPITPVPLALCHSDGTIYKTDKSVLAKALEADIEHDSPRISDVYVVDGFFILHSMKEVPKTFGSISKKFLQMVTKYPGQRIDVIFDQYWSPSIKDNERSLRSESIQMQYIIAGPEQVRPTDFSKELKNIRFKEALIDFFIKHWATSEFLRAHYIASIWKNATLKNPMMLNPLEYGWEQQDTSYVFKWFEGDQLPRLISDFIKDVSDDNEDDEQNDRDDERYQYGSLFATLRWFAAYIQNYAAMGAWRCRHTFVLLYVSGKQAYDNEYASMRSNVSVDKGSKTYDKAFVSAMSYLL